MCLIEISSKAGMLLGAQKYFIFLKDDKDQKLYTFIKDTGVDLSLTKPIDRGITGSILSESTGYSIKRVGQTRRWSRKVDELFDFVTTWYLAWPILDFAHEKL